jgi:hypothetical protein
MWSYLMRREGKPQSRCNFWSWWKQCSTMVETQGSNQRVWGVTKVIHWTQKKGRFPEIEDVDFTFFQERHKTGLFESYDLLGKEAIKKARSLNISWNHFKASTGWVIRFMCRMGLVLRRRTMTCQKILNKSCWIISGTSFFQNPSLDCESNPHLIF